MNYTVGGRVTLRPVEVPDDRYVVYWRNIDREAFFSTTVVTPDSHRDFVLNRKPHDLVWMAEISGVPVGMVSLTVDVVEATAEFGRLYVDRHFRHLGLGTEIMLTALSFAFDVLRLESVWLLTYRDFEAVLVFYRKRGWIAGGLRGDKFLLQYPKAIWEEGKGRLLEIVAKSSQGEPP